MEYFNNLYFNIIDILVFAVILTSCIVATLEVLLKNYLVLFLGFYL